MPFSTVPGLTWPGQRMRHGNVYPQQRAAAALESFFREGNLTALRELAQLIRDENVAQVLIGHSSHGRWHEFLHGSVVNNLLRRVRDGDVHVIGDG